MDHSVLHLLLVTGGAAAGVWLLCYPVRVALIRWNIIDRPNQRSSHSRPTARGGGIAIIFVLLALAGGSGLRMGQLPAVNELLAAAAVLAAVSFADDLRSLPASVRFGCHALAAVAILAALGWPHLELGLSPQGTLALPAVLGLGLAFVWIAGYTNAFNFMDGINGIAAGQAAITGLGMALLAGVALRGFSSPPVLLSLIVAGAALGFLPLNFPRARMFMGDVGSAPLGFLLAALTLWLAKTAGWWLLLPLALLHTNFVLDTGITLVRRIAKGERWYEAHREHFYQKLVRSGRSHVFVTGVEMCLQGVVLALMVLYLFVPGVVRLALVCVVLVIWGAFFLYCERCFQAHQRRGEQPVGRSAADLIDRAA